MLVPTAASSANGGEGRCNPSATQQRHDHRVSPSGLRPERRRSRPTLKQALNASASTLSSLLLDKAQGQWIRKPSRQEQPSRDAHGQMQAPWWPQAAGPLHASVTASNYNHGAGQDRSRGKAAFKTPRGKRQPNAVPIHGGKTSEEAVYPHVASQDDETTATISGRRSCRCRQRRVRLDYLEDQSWHRLDHWSISRRLCCSDPHCERERSPPAWCESAGELWAA